MEKASKRLQQSGSTKNVVQMDSNTHSKNEKCRTRYSLSPNLGKQQLKGKRIFMHYEKNHKPNFVLEKMLKRLKASLVDFFDRDVHYIITSRPAHLVPPCSVGNTGSECQSSAIFSPAPSPLSHPGTPVPNSPHSLNHAGNDQDVSQHLFPTPPSGGQSPSIQSNSSHDADSSISNSRNEAGGFCRGKALLLASQKANLNRATPLRSINNVSQPVLSRGQRMLANLIGRTSGNDLSNASPTVASPLTRKPSLTGKSLNIQPNDILVKARNLGIRIVTTEAVMKWIYSLPPDILYYVKNSCNVDDDIVEDPKQDKISGVRRLATPCLKVIDLNGDYRPVYKERAEYEPSFWPESTADIKTKKSNCTQLNLSEAQTQPIAEQSKKTKKQENSGFCECCLKSFRSLSKHLTTSSHKEFASNSDNFRFIDDVIQQMPTFLEVTSRKVDNNDSRKTKKDTAVVSKKISSRKHEKDDTNVHNSGPLVLQEEKDTDKKRDQEIVKSETSNHPHQKSNENDKVAEPQLELNDNLETIEKVVSPESVISVSNKQDLVESEANLHEESVDTIPLQTKDFAENPVSEAADINAAMNCKTTTEKLEVNQSHNLQLTGSIFDQSQTTSDVTFCSPSIAYCYPNYLPVTSSTPYPLINPPTFGGHAEDSLTSIPIPVMALSWKPRKVDLDADSSSSDESISSPLNHTASPAIAFNNNSQFNHVFHPEPTDRHSSFDISLLPRFSDEDETNTTPERHPPNISRIVDTVIDKLSEADHVKNNSKFPSKLRHASSKAELSCTYDKRLYIYLVSKAVKMQHLLSAIKKKRNCKNSLRIDATALETDKLCVKEVDTSNVSKTDSRRGKLNKSKFVNNSELDVRFKICPQCLKMHLPIEFDIPDNYICEFMDNIQSEEKQSERTAFESNSKFQSDSVEERDHSVSCHSIQTISDCIDDPDVDSDNGPTKCLEEMNKEDNVVLNDSQVCSALVHRTTGNPCPQEYGLIEGSNPVEDHESDLHNSDNGPPLCLDKMDKEDIVVLNDSQVCSALVNRTTGNPCPQEYGLIEGSNPVEHVVNSDSDCIISHISAELNNDVAPTSQSLSNSMKDVRDGEFSQVSEKNDSNQSLSSLESFDNGTSIHLMEDIDSDLPNLKLTPNRRAKAMAVKHISKYKQHYFLNWDTTNHHSTEKEFDKPKKRKFNKKRVKRVLSLSSSSETDVCRNEIASTSLHIRTRETVDDNDNVLSPPLRLPPKFSLARKQHSVINDSSTDECSFASQAYELQKKNHFIRKRKLSPPSKAVSSARKRIRCDSSEDWNDCHSSSRHRSKVHSEFGTPRPKRSTAHYNRENLIDTIASPRSFRRAAEVARTGIKLHYDYYDY